MAVLGKEVEECRADFVDAAHLETRSLVVRPVLTQSLYRLMPNGREESKL